MVLILINNNIKQLKTFTNIMKETLNLIKSLADVTENSYLAHKISILETEIEIAILDAEIKVYNNILKK